MALFFMFGRYSSDSIRGISSRRTERASAIVERFGGQTQGIYALLGDHDLVVIADFPATEDAMKASIKLRKVTGITFSTCPAVSVEQFDLLSEET